MIEDLEACCCLNHPLSERVLSVQKSNMKRQFAHRAGFVEVKDKKAD